jgi:hypothetical protein
VYQSLEIHLNEDDIVIIYQVYVERLQFFELMSVRPDRSLLWLVRSYNASR